LKLKFEEKKRKETNRKTDDRGKSPDRKKRKQRKIGKLAGKKGKGGRRRWVNVKSKSKKFLLGWTPLVHLIAYARTFATSLGYNQSRDR